MKSYRMKYGFITGTALVLIGAIAIAPVLYYDYKNQQAIAEAAGKQVLLPDNRPSKPNTISGHPVRLKIPSLNMNLQIINGHYNKNTGAWTLTLDKAQFADITALPNNEKGNTFIYGHYRPEVFAYLHTIKKDALVYIYTDNGYQFVYVFRSAYVIPPTNTSIFTYTGKPKLTIQTCTGAYFQNRQLFSFDFVKVQKVDK